MGPKTRTCALFPVVSVFSCEARVVSCTIQRMKILENIYKICAVHSNFETTGSPMGVRGSRGKMENISKFNIDVKTVLIALFSGF